jgi:hypothetical protein
MKKYLLPLLSVLALVGCGEPNMPEYDGAYIKGSSEYLEVKSINHDPKAFVWIPNKTNGGLDRRGRGFYTKSEGEAIVDAKKWPTGEFVKVKAEDFEGILIKGKYSMSHFSLHHVVTVPRFPQVVYDFINKEKPDTDELVPILNKHNLTGMVLGGAHIYNIFKKVNIHFEGDNISFKQKTLESGEVLTVPEKNLEKGKYVAWIGKDLWWFELI